MPRLLVLLAALAAALPCAIPAHAQGTEDSQQSGLIPALTGAAQLQLSGDGDVATLTGTIGLGTGKAFAALAMHAPQLRMLRLESPGGVVQEARVVADVVRTLHLDTFVARGCASACTMIFFAGEHRWLQPTARLGFHSYAAAGRRKVTTEQIDAAQDVERKSFQEAGLAGWFIKRIFETPNAEIWMPSAQEMLAAHFATNITLDDYPVRAAPAPGMPAVNYPMAASDAPLPKVIGP